MRKPWIKIGGVLINLNYIIKVVRIDTAAPVYGICFFHASAGVSGGNPTGTQKVTFADAATADAKFVEIQQIMESHSAITDLS